eukprot:TRINITY_DN13983_c0_g1_i1.p1 TRINITY_DN13983_c0_g1~~TRINITY_DN13983_c0_g1_i1.p1  ORF type:complete len:102 (+),score=19.60 TRINITY_DN13983_c0_g1_i1:131-436(+)
MKATTAASASLGSAAKSVSSKSLTASIASDTKALASLGSAANSVSSRSATLAISAATSSCVTRGKARETLNRAAKIKRTILTVLLPTCRPRAATDSPCTLR